MMRAMSSRGKLRDIKLELFESQSEIIRLQNEAIKGLIGELLQYTTVEELDLLPAIKKLNEAAMIRNEHQL